MFCSWILWFCPSSDSLHTNRRKLESLSDLENCGDATMRCTNSHEGLSVRASGSFSVTRASIGGSWDLNADFHIETESCLQMNNPVNAFSISLKQRHEYLVNHR